MPEFMKCFNEHCLLYGQMQQVNELDAMLGPEDPHALPANRSETGPVCSDCHHPLVAGSADDFFETIAPNGISHQ